MVTAAIKAISGSTTAIAMPIAIVGPRRWRERALSASAARGAISSNRAPKTSSERVTASQIRKPVMPEKALPMSGQSCLVTSPWTRASSATRGCLSP